MTSSNLTEAQVDVDFQSKFFAHLILDPQLQTRFVNNPNYFLDQYLVCESGRKVFALLLKWRQSFDDPAEFSRQLQAMAKLFILVVALVKR